MMHRRHLLTSCAYRLRQALAFVRPQQPPVVPDDIARYLRPGTLERFRELPAADQHHLLAVGETLRTSDVPETCWIAGFLHDIGKVHEGHHVRTIDRGLWVIAARIPFIAATIRRQPTMPRFGGGLWIAAHHATIGHELLRDLGYPERICALVFHHEDVALAGQDTHLRWLQAVDDATCTIPMYARSEAYGLPA